MSGKLSTELFKRIRHRTTRTAKTILLLKILSLSFLVKSTFLLLDLATDVVLIREYYQLWQRQEAVAAERAAEAAGEKILFPGTVGIQFRFRSS